MLRFVQSSLSISFILFWCLKVSIFAWFILRYNCFVNFSLYFCCSSLLILISLQDYCVTFAYFYFYSLTYIRNFSNLQLNISISLLLPRSPFSRSFLFYFSHSLSLSFSLLLSLNFHISIKYDNLKKWHLFFNFPPRINFSSRFARRLGNGMKIIADAKEKSESYNTHVIDVDLSLVHEFNQHFDVREFDVTHDDDGVLLLVLR